MKERKNGYNYLVQLPRIPTLKDVYVDPLEKLSDYIDAIKRTINRLQPILDELQRQELLPQEKLKPKIVISQPQFKKQLFVYWRIQNQIQKKYHKLVYVEIYIQ